MLRTRSLTTLAALFSAVAVGALSACGGDGGGEVGNLSKGAFAAKANALCATAQAERSPLLQQLPPTPTGPADAQALQSVVTIDRELVRHVDDLVPPEAEQDSVDRVLDAWRRRANVENQYAAAVGAMQDPQALASFTANLAQIDATADPIATQLGMTKCTRGTP